MTRAIVIDAAGFFSGHVLLFSHDRIFTVKEVVEEIKDPMSRAIYENAVSAGKINVLEPSISSIRKAIDAAAEEGIIDALSEADKKLLALALDLVDKGYEVLLITDDSYLHRLARKLGIKTKGVRRPVPRFFKPRLYVCRVCGYRTMKRTETCPQCGSKVY
ncbi:MAG TPA: hypothetical protein VNL13_00495 [Sulfolobales archaeon]|nr:hypothetical protein [Sulfolobales archaeon]